MFIYGATQCEQDYYVQRISQIERNHLVKYNIYGDMIMDGSDFCDDIVNFAVDEDFTVDEEYTIVSKKKAVTTFILTDARITIILTYIIKRKGLRE